MVEHRDGPLIDPLREQEIDPCRPYRRGRLSRPHHAGLVPVVPLALEGHHARLWASLRLAAVLRWVLASAGRLRRSQAPYMERPRLPLTRRLTGPEPACPLPRTPAMHDGPPCSRPGQPSPCPTWCRADHAADMQRRREMAAEVDRQLGVPPGQGLVVETYLLHTVEVGWMSVRVGRDEPLGMLRVTVEQIEDIDSTAWSTGLLVRIEEPPGWTEDFTLDEARELAALLVRAGQVARA